MSGRECRSECQDESCVQATNPSLYCVDTKDSFATEQFTPVNEEPKIPKVWIL